MRVKTATFTSPDYLDLTTGTYCVLISSPYHENFAGIILKVEYDPSSGLYNYQCQDFSRVYQSKFELIGQKIKVHRLLQFLITRGAISTNGKVTDSLLNEYKNVLSGLRPAYQYEQEYFNPSIKDFNPMTMKYDYLIRDKSYIEVIRDIVFGSGAFIDVYFDDYGILHVEPYMKDEWLNTGLHLTTQELMESKYTFDTTNIITSVIVKNSDSKKGGTAYKSIDLVDLNLSAFFGSITAMIGSDSKTNTSTGASSNAKNTVKKKTSNTKSKTSNVYGTKKKNIYLNTDSITGYSSDMKRMKDMKKLLEKHGWNVHITGVGAEAHWKQRDKVKNGIWFCLYGGACAGTLKEHCTSSWFLNPLKKNKSRVVVGFFPPSGNIRHGGKYYKHLGPAHDWQGNRAYANIDYPAKFLSKKGVPFMYANNAKQMVSKFLAGGDNYKTTGKSYSYHGSWQKHKLGWLK